MVITRWKDWGAISLSSVEPHVGGDGWVFPDAGGEFPDPLHGARFVREI